MAIDSPWVRPRVWADDCDAHRSES
jgi:hypothetical protein